MCGMRQVLLERSPVIEGGFKQIVPANRAIQFVRRDLPSAHECDLAVQPAHALDELRFKPRLPRDVRSPAKHDDVFHDHDVPSRFKTLPGPLMMSLADGSRA